MGFTVLFGAVTLNSPLVDRFCQFVLFDWAAKGMILLAGAWIATRLLERSSAATRHLVWLLTFAGMFLLPAVSTFAPRLRVLPALPETQAVESWIAAVEREEGGPHASGPRATPAGAAEDGVQGPIAPVDRGPVATAAAVAVPVAKSWWQLVSWRFWVTAVWAGGVAVMLLRLLAGWLRLGRLERAAQRVEESDWIALLDEQAARLGIRRRVVLLRSQQSATAGDAAQAKLATEMPMAMPMAMPMTWGAFHPKLLLPAESARWDSERRRIVLLHELAHIKRSDCPAQWLAHLVRSVHWFNPLAWIAFRRATLEREQACDDLVLAAGVKPSVYGEQLLAVARGVSDAAHAPLAAIAMAQASTFERRLHAILDVGRDRRPVTAKTALAVLAVELALILPLAALHGAGPQGPAGSNGAGQAPPASAAPAGVQPEAGLQAIAALSATKTMPDLLGRVWTESLNEFARSKRTGPEFALIGLFPNKNAWVNPQQLAWVDNTQQRRFLRADAPIDTIAQLTKRGDLYVPESNMIQPIHNTVMAPLAVRSSPSGDKTVLLDAIAETSCEELVRQVIAYDMAHPRIADPDDPFSDEVPGPEAQRVAAGDAFAIFKPSGLLFVMGVFGPPEDLRVQIILIGLSIPSRVSAVQERIIFPVGDEDEGFAFFDFETGNTLKPPFPLKFRADVGNFFDPTPELMSWIQQTGVDVALYLDDTNWYYTTLDMAMSPLGGAEWDKLTAFQVIDRLDLQQSGAATMPGSANIPHHGGQSYGGDVPSMFFAFRTRENTYGALEWSGISTPARGVKIRYKFNNFVVGVAPPGEAKPVDDKRGEVKPAVPTPASDAEPAAEVKPAAGQGDGATGVKDTKSTLEGVCLDEHKQPLAGVHVRLFAVAPDLDPLRQTELLIEDVPSGNDGRFRLADIDVAQIGERGYFEVVAQAPGRASATRMFTRLEGTVGIDLELPPAAALRGRIVDTEGKPVKGAIVSAGTSAIPGVLSATTDADGRYEIADFARFDLADQKPQDEGNGVFSFGGAPSIMVRDPDYAPLRIPYTKVPGVVDGTLRRAAAVQGQVVLAESGKPAVGAQVELDNDLVPSNFSTRTKTDDEGHYELKNVPPGDYRIFVILPGRTNLVRTGVALKSGQNKLDLRMEQGGAIRGRVVDVTSGKAPQRGKDERMQILRCDEKGVVRPGTPLAEIAPDGTFTLSLPAGRNHLGMYLGPKWRGVDTDALLEDGVVVSEGETVELTIHIEPNTP